jgi:hypothetical protein
VDSLPWTFVRYAYDPSITGLGIHDWKFKLPENPDNLGLEECYSKSIQSITYTKLSRTQDANDDFNNGLL